MASKHVVKLTGVDPYTKDKVSTIRYGLCDDCGTLISEHTCRERAATSYRNHLGMCSMTKYWIVFSHSPKGNSLSLMTEKVNGNIGVLNSLEHKFGLKPTSVEIFDGYYEDGGRVDFIGAPPKGNVRATVIPTVFEFTMDELWLSAPPLMSLHMMLNRLNHAARQRKVYHDFDAVEHDLANDTFKSMDKGFFFSRGKWKLLLENLFDVFPSDRSYTDNWSFCVSGSAAGIHNFVGGSGEDAEASANFGKICVAKK